MTERMRTGEHLFWHEPEAGLTCIAYNGMLNEAEVAEMQVVIEKWQDMNEPCFYLIDNRNSTGLTGGARKAIAKTGEERSGQVYCAIFGAGFALRVVLNLLFKAMELTSNKNIVRFANDEADARAWLVEHRRAHLARKKAG